VPHDKAPLNVAQSSLRGGNFRAPLQRIAYVEDSAPQEPVSCELLSAVRFPDHQGKYREFARF
jgi:hypothetical protein